MSGQRFDEAGNPLCDCPVGEKPCQLSPQGRAKKRRGRCEGCAMGIHKGHKARVA